MDTGHTKTQTTPQHCRCAPPEPIPLPAEAARMLKAQGLTLVDLTLKTRCSHGRVMYARMVAGEKPIDKQGEIV